MTKNSARIEVVIIEDDSGTRKLMANILSSHGFYVKEASNGANAVKEVDGDTKLALVDIGLPDFDGLNVVTRLRRKFDRSRLKICFVSGLSEVQVVKDALKTGGDDYIVKPIDPEILLHKISKLLGQKSQEFAWVTVNLKSVIANCNVLPELKIVRLSETGLLFKSNSQFVVDAIVTIDCESLNSILPLKLVDCPQRIVSCEKIGNSWLIATVFVGLVESQAKVLRSLAIRGAYISDDTLEKKELQNVPDKQS